MRVLTTGRIALIVIRVVLVSDEAQCIVVLRARSSAQREERCVHPGVMIVWVWAACATKTGAVIAVFVCGCMWLPQLRAAATEMVCQAVSLERHT